MNAEHPPANSKWSCHDPVVLFESDLEALAICLLCDLLPVVNDNRINMIMIEAKVLNKEMDLLENKGISGSTLVTLKNEMKQKEKEEKEETSAKRQKTDHNMDTSASPPHSFISTPFPKNNVALLCTTNTLKLPSLTTIASSSSLSSSLSSSSPAPFTFTSCSVCQASWNQLKMTECPLCTLLFIRSSSNNYKHTTITTTTTTTTTLPFTKSLSKSLSCDSESETCRHILEKGPRTGQCCGAAALKQQSKRHGLCSIHLQKSMQKQESRKRQSYIYDCLDQLEWESLSWKDIHQPDVSRNMLPREVVKKIDESRGKNTKRFNLLHVKVVVWWLQNKYMYIESAILEYGPRFPKQKNEKCLAELFECFNKATQISTQAISQVIRWHYLSSALKTSSNYMNDVTMIKNKTDKQVILELIDTLCGDDDDDDDDDRNTLQKTWKTSNSNIIITSVPQHISDSNTQETMHYPLVTRKVKPF